MCRCAQGCSKGDPRTKNIAEKRLCASNRVPDLGHGAYTVNPIVLIICLRNGDVLKKGAFRRRGPDKFCRCPVRRPLRATASAFRVERSCGERRDYLDIQGPKPRAPTVEVRCAQIDATLTVAIMKSYCSSQPTIRSPPAERKRDAN